MAKAGEIVAKLRLDIADYQKNIEKSKSELTNFSDTTKKVAKGIGTAFVAIGTAMAGVAVASGKMALENEKALSKIQAQTYMTDEQMKEFKDTADNLFLGGRGSYEEIYDTLGRIKQVLGESGDVAGETAEGVLLLNEIFGYETPESIRAIESANKAWGSSSKDTLDLITALSQQAGDKADDLLDTFWEYAPVMAEAGYSAEDFGNILNEGMEAGAFNFDKIGDALKEFNVRLTDGSTQANGMAEELFGSAKASETFFKGISSGKITSADALGTITDKLREIEDPIKRNTLGVAFFGTMWEDLGSEVMLAMGDADDSLMMVEGSLEEAGKILDDNLLTKIDGIRRQFVYWAKELGEQMLPAISKLTDFVLENLPSALGVLTDVLTVAGDGFMFVADSVIASIEFLKEHQKTIGIIAGIIAALLIPSLVGWAAEMVLVNGVIKGMYLLDLIKNTVASALANYKLGLSYLAVHKSALLALGVFGLLIAGALLLYKNWDLVVAKLAEFGITSESVSAFVTGLKDRIVELWESFKGSGILGIVGGYVQGLVDKFVALYNGIKTAISAGDFTPLLEAVQNLFPMIIGLFLGGIPKLLIVGGNLLKAVADGMGITVPQLIEKITNVIVSMIEQFAILLPQFINTGIMILTTLLDGLIQALPSILDAITAVVNVLVESVTMLLPIIVDAGLNVLMALIDGIVDNLPFLTGAIIGILLALVAVIVSKLPTILDAGVKILLALIEGILKVMPSLLEAGLKLITSLFGAIVGALPAIIEAGIKILFALIKGILQILPQLLGVGLQLVWELGKTLIANAPQILAAGIKLIWALIKGILSLLGEVSGAMSDIGSAILDKLGEISLVDIGKDLIRGLWNGISDMTGWIGRKIKGFGDGVLSGLKSFFGIHSPSRVFRDEIGVMLVRGLNIGIDKMKKLPLDTLGGIADDMVGTFDNLGNIDVAPQISGLATADVDISRHVDVGEGSDGGTNYNAPIVQVENMHVREENDVRSVSRELFNLQRTKDRSQGGK